MTASEERLSITYSLTCEGGEAAFALARRIAFGLVGGLPGSELGTAPAERLAGRVEEIERLDASVWVAVVSLDAEVVSDDATQLLRLVGGGSRAGSAEICEVRWPASLLQRFGGPRFGAAGLAARLPESAAGPLAGASLGPLGWGAERLAARAVTLVEAGADLVIDELALGDQRWAPLAERAARCVAAVQRAAERRGRAALYAPNLTGASADLERRIAGLAECGVESALVAPFLVGPDLLRRLAAEAGLLLVAALAGGPAAGSRLALDAELLRLLGADAIALSSPGRGSADDEARHRLARRLRRPLGDLRASSLVSVETGGRISTPNRPGEGRSSGDAAEDPSAMPV